MSVKETVLIKGLYSNTTVYYCTIVSNNNYYSKQLEAGCMWFSAKDVFSVEDLVTFANIFKAKPTITALRKNFTYITNIEPVLLKDTPFIKYIPQSDR